MSQNVKLSEEILIGGQPTEEELGQLAKAGYHSIVNLRMEAEEIQCLAPAEEGGKVRRLGLEYLHIPVSMQEPKHKQVDEFHAKMKELPKPVFVHCRSGMRAGFFVVMDMGLTKGMSAGGIMRQAQEMGIDLEAAGLRPFLEEHLKQQGK